MTRRRPRGAKIPHALELYGKVWKVRWYDPDKDDNEAGWVKHQAGQTNFDERTIRISAKLRYDLQLAWETLMHEVMHVIDAYEAEWRREHEKKTRKDKSSQLAWRRLENGNHENRDANDVIYRLDLALGRMFADNRVTFACACTRCYGLRKKEILAGEEL